MEYGSHSSTRLPVVIFAIVVLASSAALPVLSFVTAQSTSASCPASDTLRMVEYSGVPTTLNSLATYDPAGFFVTSIAFVSAGAPLRGDNGIPYNYTSIFDSISHNSNYTVWTFHIGSTAVWSNGQPVTSTDVKNQYSSNFALDPNFDPTFPPLHSEITSITTPDASTAVFHLNATDAHLDVRMSLVLDAASLYPSSWTTTSQGAGFNGFGTSVGDGPFYVDNYQAGQNTLTLLRNPHYTPQPTVCKIVINFVENIAQTSTYLASGQSDLAYIPSGAAATLAALPNVKVLTQPGELITYIEYNQTQYPYNMTAFRQALIYGINESAISSIAYNGYSTPAYSAEGAVPTTSSIYNPNQKQYSYNPQEALSLLNSMGITKGSDGFLHYQNGTVVHFTLWSDDDVFSDAETAPLVLNNLRSLGFQVTLQEIPWTTMTGYGFKNSFGMDNGLMLHTSQALYPGDSYAVSYPVNFLWAAFWMPTSPELMPASANAQYLSNFTAISATNNPAQELVYARNIQALNAQYLPWCVPLTYNGLTMAYSTAHFTGWPNPTSGYMLPTAIFWNDTALTSLKPVQVVTTAAPTVTVTGAGATTTVAGAGTTTTVTGAGATTTVTAQAAAAASNTMTIALGVVAVVVIVAIIAIALSRRKPS